MLALFTSSILCRLHPYKHSIRILPLVGLSDSQGRPLDFGSITALHSFILFELLKRPIELYQEISSFLADYTILFKQY